MEIGLGRGDKSFITVLGQVFSPHAKKTETKNDFFLTIFSASIELWSFKDHDVSRIKSGS